MILKVLVENTTIDDNLRYEHGISLYLETNNHKMLFDLGMSDLFLENAKKLDVNIKEIDSVIISHGHNDHGGGLKYFLNENDKAKIYLSDKAFIKHYALRPNDKMEYIGLDQELKDNPRINFIDKITNIYDGITIFQNVENKYKLPLSNRILYMEKDGNIVKDDFLHEQDLIIKENGKYILFTGCSHNGIKNIIEEAYKIIGKMPDYVIGGFHLSSRTGGSETKEYVEELANYLLDTKAMFYTCHCTGLKQYEILKDIMGNRINYLATGCVINLK